VYSVSVYGLCVPEMADEDEGALEKSPFVVVSDDARDIVDDARD
jgi:hypothetical protein